MTSVAYLFPGQGAQEVGMGQDAYQSSVQARAVFQEADTLLGFGLSKLCFEGPAEELTRTVNAQPAIMVTSMALLAAARELGEASLGGAAALVAGHSLGEYSAMIAAGALPFADALRLVRRRGELMEECGRIEGGTMAAVLGMETEAVFKLAADAGVEVGNINAPGQATVSGTVAGVLKAMELAKERGATRVVQLDVSGAFHSRLMRPAQEGLMTAVALAPFVDAAVPVVGNSTAAIVRSAEDLRLELVNGLTQPVLWANSVQTMAASGVDLYVEIGAGRVLTGLVRRTVEGAKVVNLNSVAAIQKAAGAS
ncbi:MAG: [acyl-carrier-protein] S-malonyltransferase [Dehalococcoidia bacterium]|nr:[acyl-carrier-protein] S-malonyltransferase [Dehalococcoidia bacterium]